MGLETGHCNGATSTSTRALSDSGPLWRSGRSLALWWHSVLVMPRRSCPKYGCTSYDRPCIRLRSTCMSSVPEGQPRALEGRALVACLNTPASPAAKA